MKSHLYFVIVLGALSALGPLAIDMYLPSFPNIASELQVEPDDVQRTVAIYFLGLSLGQLLYGPFSDRVGRKLPLFLGLLLFMIGSAGCALSQNIEALTFFRLIQALGGCSQMVITRAIVRDNFNDNDSVRIFSSLILVMGVAPIVAPLLGGFFVTFWSWRSIFWFLTLFCAFCLFAVGTLQESLAVEHRQRQDVKQIFVGYLNLLRQRNFMAATFAGGLTMAGMFAYIAGSPFVFITLFGVPQEKFGIYFGLNAAGFIVVSQFNRVLLRRWTSVQLVKRTLALAATAASAMFAFAYFDFGGFAGVLVPLFIFVASLGLVVPNSSALAMSSQTRNAGSASALLGTLQFLIAALASGAVSVFHNGTALPMAGIMSLSGLLAFAGFVGFWRE